MARTKKVYVEENIEQDGVKYFLAGVVHDPRKEVRHKALRVEDLVKNWNDGTITRDIIMQRTAGQWSPSQKTALILSMLKERSIGSILVARDKKKACSVYLGQALLDGLQRVSTIADYVNGKFSLAKNLPFITVAYYEGDSYEDIDESDNYITKDIDISGLKFSQLPKMLQRAILDYMVDRYMYIGFTDDELDEIMYNVNNGTAFKASQKLRTAYGNKVMRKLQPVIDDPFWKDVSGVSAKTDTILGCVTRTMMYISQRYEGDSLSAGNMKKFASTFEQEFSKSDIDQLVSLFKDLFEANKYLSDEDKEIFSACTVTQILMAYYERKDFYNITSEIFADFIKKFYSSNAYEEFDRLCRGSGSGGGQYNVDRMDERHDIIREEMIMYLIHCVNNGTITEKQELTNNEEVDDNATGDSTDEMQTVEEGEPGEGGEVEATESNNGQGTAGDTGISGEGQDDSTVSEDI